MQWLIFLITIETTKQLIHLHIYQLRQCHWSKSPNRELHVKMINIHVIRYFKNSKNKQTNKQTTQQTNKQKTKQKTNQNKKTKTKTKNKQQQQQQNKTKQKKTKQNKTKQNKTKTKNISCPVP